MAPNSLCGWPLLLYFPGERGPHIKNFRWGPNWGVSGTFLYVYVLFLLLRSEAPKRGRKNGAARKLSKSVEKLFDTF